MKRELAERVLVSVRDVLGVPIAYSRGGVILEINAVHTEPGTIRVLGSGASVETSEPELLVRLADLALLGSVAEQNDEWVHEGVRYRVAEVTPDKLGGARLRGEKRR